MIIEYCRTKTYNFGDDLNLWLWPQLMGHEVFKNDDNIFFLGIGTILTKKRFENYLSNADKIVVFSSGGWEQSCPKLDERCIVYGVRGPFTAEKLGVSSSLAIGDGAYLLADFLPDCNQQKDIGFIPHHKSEAFIDWELICKQVGLKFISPQQPVEKCLQEMSSCKKILAEAMHGAIVADVMRIPWMAVSFSPLFCKYKWLDFAEPLDLKINFNELQFFSQTRTPVGKAIEGSLKKISAKLMPNLPNKWGKQPVVFKPAGEKELDVLRQKLYLLAFQNDGQLSKDTKIKMVTERQQAIAAKVVQDYHKGFLL